MQAGRDKNRSPVETPGTTNLIQIKTCEESR